MSDKLTTNRNDPRLTHGVDEVPVPQADAYLILSDEERAKGFVRPVRRSYRHVGTSSTDPLRHDDKPNGCGSVTTMGEALAETYAANPKFYGATYCVYCQKHRPVGEFDWEPAGNGVVGS